MAKLYLVPTPIGNLEDITFRAINVLREADIIFAEDTRKTSILLKHYDISKPLRSYHQFNEHRQLASFMEVITGVQSTALVSDAGTPGISDPGFMLIRECIKNEIDIECLPGPTAFLPALINSGFPSEKFVFEGFLPQKKGRNKRLKAIADEPRTMIFYESPYRIERFINELAEVFGGERPASISREITKIHEETIRGSLSELSDHLSGIKPKGEFVVVVKGNS